MDVATQILINIAIAGGAYSVAALGFNLIYSTGRFVDLGFGTYILVGGYAVLYFYKWLSLPLSVSMVLGVFVAGVTGFLIEKVVYRPLREKHASNTVLLIASLGVFTVGQAVLAMIFSSQFQTLARNIGGERLFYIGAGVITETQILIIAIALLTMIGIAWMLRRTMFGTAVRAIADDEEVAQIVGINTERVIGIVFFIGAALGGVVGIAHGFDTGLQPLGFELLLEAVVAAVIGGVGNPYGSVLGGFLLALTENVGAWQFGGEWKFPFAFFMLVIFLLFRPQGILPNNKK